MSEDDCGYIPTHYGYYAAAKLMGITHGQIGMGSFTDSGLPCICKKCRVEYASGFAIGLNKQLSATWYVLYGGSENG